MSGEAAAAARRVNTVLLDFGGTLDADGVHWSTMLAAAFGEAGVQVERPTLDQAFLVAGEELERWPSIATCGLEAHAREHALRMLARLGRDQSCAVAIAHIVTRRTDAHLRRSVELLRAARAASRGQLRFGIVSNFTANLERIVREVGLDQVLDALVCSEVVGLRKPDLAIFRLALDRLGARPEESAMIGDSLSADIAPARALGLVTIWLHGDEVFGGGDPSAADHEVTSLAAALELCAPRGGGG